MLPPEIARCPGRDREVKEGDWPFPSGDPACVKCARRVAGIADYMSGAAVTWMEQAPKGEPCPERLGMKK